MSSIGTGYDLSASQFSPDGRVFQVQYRRSPPFRLFVCFFLKLFIEFLIPVYFIIQIYPFLRFRPTTVINNTVGTVPVPTNMLNTLQHI